MNAPVHILYFAWLRERAGAGSEDVVLPDWVSDVGGLIDWLRARSPGMAQAFADPALVRCAVNQEFGNAATKVKPGDEVAFFPPVTGG